MKQQKQTLKYFNENAAVWDQKASSAQFNVIDNRHKAVFEVMNKYAKAGKLLDIGCGTGQLVIEAANNGWKSVGIDYASSMIEICKLNAGVDNKRIEFYCASIFDYDVLESEYDVISAQGLIEYISHDELNILLKKVSSGLKDGGSIALGSRNRLFNLHSLNEYSTLELKLGVIDKLMHESIILQNAVSQSEAIEKLSKLEYHYIHPNNHPETGIKVSRRFQFSPADLMGRLIDCGLSPTRIFPVNFHGLPLSVLTNKEFKPLHLEMAELIGKKYINSPTFIPFSSSFVIEAKKI